MLPCLCALALASCFANPPSTVEPPADPPSGEIRPDEVIPYEQLEEHLQFNTKSRVRLHAFVGHVLQVRAPVWRVEQDGVSGVLCLGSDGKSLVQANFADLAALRHFRLGQEVIVSGVFQIRNPGVVLEDARLKE
jgi:hypothetical protein